MTEPANAHERWKETWALVGRPAPAEALDRLVARYGERHRAYHDLRHVLACLELARSVRAELDSPAAVELALWYHDAIYDPHAADNEEQSAELATSELAGLDTGTLATVSRLIRVTRHDGVPADSDARYLVDIDLAVLGSPDEEFDRYQAAIRREYRWVPAPLYRRRRREILQRFLARPQIYSTSHFRTRFETKARAHLTRAIEGLSRSS
jgi:predicted metal-dependent HD superfamily phosphohydrolase